MGLESASTISQLSSSNPTVSDDFSQGDDHLRLIKSVLKFQFPGVGGQGFATAITATETELNYVHGVTSAVQTQLNTLSAGILPSGTRQPFFQASAPTGWTLVTTHNNKMLRVVSGTGGGSGGADDPTVMNKVPSHSHTFAGDALATHTHAFDRGSSVLSVSLSGGGTSLWVGSSTPNTSASSGGTPSGTISTNSGAANWQPLYIDVIICSKN